MPRVFGVMTKWSATADEALAAAMTATASPAAGAHVGAAVAVPVAGVLGGASAAEKPEAAVAVRRPQRPRPRLRRPRAAGAAVAARSVVLGSTIVACAISKRVGARFCSRSLLE